jgi:hypothetical protein
MSDIDRDDIVATAVEGFRRDGRALITPPGAQAVRRTVHRRRRVRTGALAALVAVLILGPSGAYLGYGRSHSGPLPPGTSAAPTPSRPASPSPSPAPSQSSTGAPSTAPRAGDAPADLANATFTVAKWTYPNSGTCPSGRITFHGGQHSGTSTSTLVILNVVQADVNGDGGKESLATVLCRLGEAGPKQVVALTAPAGTLRTLGQVFQSTADAADVLALTPAANGRIDVRVGDIIRCCGTPPEYLLTQVRSFGWSGGRFRQTGGPTTFAADPSQANLTVRTATVAVGAPTNGVRTGTLTVVLHNGGPHRATQVALVLSLSQTITIGSGSGQCPPIPAGNQAEVCHLGSVAAGADLTVSLPVSYSNQQGDTPGWYGSFEVRSGSTRYGGVRQFTFTGFG